MGSGRPHEQGKKKTEEELLQEAEALIAAQKAAELKAQGDEEAAAELKATIEKPEKDETEHKPAAQNKVAEELETADREPSERELLKQAEEREAVRKTQEKLEKAERKPEAPKPKTKKPQKPAHSERHRAMSALVDPNKKYNLDEALELVKKTSYSKFDGTVELHIRVKVKGKKGSEEPLRGVVHLPHGIGKKTTVAVAADDVIDQIAATKKTPFDVLIATPEQMPKLAKVAKILGPKGKMPNPKYGTVTDKPAELQKEIEAGRVEYRGDAGNAIHLPLGKVSWENTKLLENLNAALSAVAAPRILSATLSSTMGPGIPLVM